MEFPSLASGTAIARCRCRASSVPGKLGGAEEADCLDRRVSERQDTDWESRRPCSYGSASVRDHLIAASVTRIESLELDEQAP